MINANDDWGIIENAYSHLLMVTGLNDDQTADPRGTFSSDYQDAVEDASYSITNARFPEIAKLEAFARNGYLDNDQIWEEIGLAIARALEAFTEERWEEHLREQDDEEE